MKKTIILLAISGTSIFSVKAQDSARVAAKEVELAASPDSDGDGIPDAADSCPHQAGTLLFHGCPDSDGDGIPDDIDMCPFVAGGMDNHGCPYKKPAERDAPEEIDRALVQFEFDKVTIRKSSYAYLDSVAMKLKEHPGAVLVIDGYSDTTGSEHVNNLVSLQRAGQVKRYMMSKGINEKRLLAKGHGFSSPVADNHTRAGRARNRRASMVVTSRVASAIRVVTNEQANSFTITLISTTEEEASVSIVNSKNETVKEFAIPANKAIEFKLTQPAGLYNLSAITPTIKYEAKLVVTE
jgi:outer membrane protein OmpA-like peptidoglycan-associated protein